MKPKYSIDTISPKGKVLGIYKFWRGFHYLCKGHKRLIKEKDIEEDNS